MKPLAGVRIVVTRAQHQAEELAGPLRDNGADVILLPVIGIGRPENPEHLRRAVHSGAYDWIVFTSTNAVTAFAQELERAARPCNEKIAVVGPATRDAAEAHGFSVQLGPEKYIAESLVDAFAQHELKGCRVLIPSAAVTRDVVAPALRALGAQVDVVEAYRNIMPPEAAEQARSVFRDPYPDWITFASSSAVANLVHLVGPDSLAKSRIATIGPATSDTIREVALTVYAEANPHTVDGLVRAIVAAQLH